MDSDQLSNQCALGALSFKVVLRGLLAATLVTRFLGSPESSGHGRRVHCEAAPKACELPRLHLLSTPVSPGRVERRSRTSVTAALMYQSLLAGRCLRSHWAFEGTREFILFRSTSPREILHWKRVPRSHPLKGSATLLAKPT